MQPGLTMLVQKESDRAKNMSTHRIQNHTELGGDIVLRVDGLYKKFCRSLKRSMYYGAVDSVCSMMGISYTTDVLRKNEFWALNNVSFEMKRGETLGLIGQNGSGKTTALRLIHGIFQPDKGSIEIRGRISALIAVGAGFHPHMTGMENIYLNGTILGMKSKEIDQKLDAIIDFADIGDFLDAPVSTYSSGMRVRLGFAIAIHTYPDILLVDEILSVGDASFRGKCANKMRELQKDGISIILVSHNELTILDLCSRAILFDGGRVAYQGDVSAALTKYEEVVAHRENKKLQLGLENGNQQTGSSFTVVLSLEDGSNNKIDSIQTGQSFYVVAEIVSQHHMEHFRCTFSLKSKEGSKLLHIRNDNYGIPAFKIKEGLNILKVFIVNLALSPGVYTLNSVFVNYCKEKPFQVNKPLQCTVNGKKKSDSLLSVDAQWFLE